ncbi:hypothetical protein HDU85_002840 [Gaertneriomyces sp. JEL0708]|nr:hypothetical protein HDU85_002840 [Gaertneriomyces sp. JEL0708]
MREAQYTILATVMGNNKNSGEVNATASNYNATLLVHCIYSSFGNNAGKGGFAGQQLTVTGFGNPNPGCNNGQGADAEPTTQKIFFIHVAEGFAQGATPVFAIFNPCGGGIDNTPPNQQMLANVLAAHPANALQNADPLCKLPASNAKPTTSASPSPGTQVEKLPGIDSGAPVIVSQWPVLVGLAGAAASVLGALIA